jgi:UDP-N-acetylglucosamine pyrophosphorylase
MRTADGQLVLRESAQCADEDEKAFQDITKHRFFNTNNLWLDLEQLEALLAKTGGVVRLPTILNGKTVDPQDGASTKVVQLETAMGAAIELFAGASAIVVPRSRFAPVKKCSDLLLLRSDAYGLVNFKPTLTATPAPIVDLDSKKYKLVGQLADLTTAGVPSLKACKKLTVKGAVAFSSRVRIVGEVKVTNPTDGPLEMPPGVYENEDVVLPCEPRAPPADEVRGGAGGRGGGGGGGLSYLFCCARLRADKPVAAQSGEVV